MPDEVTGQDAEDVGVPLERPAKGGGVVVSSRTLVVIGLVVALLAGMGVGVLVIGKGSNPPPKKLAAKTGAAEVFLEPVASTGQHPFTPSVGTDQRGTLTPTSTSLATTTSTTPTAIPVSSGDTIGLYGGTRNAASCDPDKLVTFLEQNPAKAAAWAGVVGIPVSQIRAYVATLTPVILRSDTRVTNHGFVNGHTTTIPAVLQAGTAVLVDQYGLPVAKCFCGNPLSAPEPLSAPVYTGTPWPGFSQTNITVISQSTTIVNVFVLYDPQTGRGFARPAGTSGASDQNAPAGTVAPSGELLGSGALQITLTWSSTADLDLHVVDPTGTNIDYGHKTSPSGGGLDVDSNGGCENPTTAPVENIYWPTGGAPTGAYVISVDYYGQCPGGAGPQAYTITIRQNGHVTDQRAGTINPGETQTVGTFTK